MSTGPVLDVTAPPGDVRAVALVLHGGREASTAPVRPRQLAVLRMHPFASSLARAGGRHGLAVARLRYAVRGWNGETRSPVADTEWALAELVDRFGPVPVALVGHSLGGRTALYLAGHPHVRAVTALAPWIERGDPVGQLAGRRLMIVHGSWDRVTNPRASAALVERSAAIAESAGYVRVRHETHAMLLRPRVWHSLATRYTLAALDLAEGHPTGLAAAALAGASLAV